MAASPPGHQLGANLTNTSPSPPTLASEARVATAMPSRYLTQFCKHFQNKLPVAIEERHGRIEFAAGICELDVAASPDTLTLRVTAGNGTALATLEEVVARYLKRFAFRGEPDIRWTRAA